MFYRFAYISEAEFVRKYAVERESIKEMVERISLVLRRHIDDVKWMNEVVKNVAFSEITNMSVIIGGPEEMYHEDGFNKFLGIDQVNAEKYYTCIQQPTFIIPS